MLSSVSAAIEVTITSPSGEIFDRSSPSYEEDLIFKKVLIKIPDIAEVIIYGNTKFTFDQIRL